MSTTEAGVVVGHGNEPIYWHLPQDRSVAYLPDNRDLWDAIWTSFQDGNLLGFAHSHPGKGIPYPSTTDIDTFQNIEAALGRPLSWWIASEDHVVLIQRVNLYVPYERDLLRGRELLLPWLYPLRHYSGFIQGIQETSSPQQEHV
jgi:hypothetical protein